MKVGIGAHNNDADVNLSPRGLIHALSVEVVDGSGQQVTSFAPKGFILNNFDYFSVEINGSTKVYTFRSGGATGSVVNTVTVNYTDGTRTEVLNAYKT